MEVLCLSRVMFLWFICCPLWLLTPSALVGAMPSIYPAKDQYVASNSLVNVTFNCSAPIGSNPGWEINGSQIVGDDFIQRISRMGIFIYSDGQYSLIIVTPKARFRPEYKVLSMECLSTHNETLSTDNTKNYSVITFDPPGMPIFLRLMLSQTGELLLKWDRPQNMRSGVDVTYMIVINGSNIDDSMVISNTTTFELLPLGFLEDQLTVNRRRCEMFEFTVQAVNEAGSGPVSKPIIDTVPISLDVTKISAHLIVEKVDLQPLTVTIAFPSAEVCMNVTLQNYTVRINKIAAHNVTASEVMPSPDDTIRLKLSEETLSTTITLGGSFNLSISACTDIACLVSEPVILNTTGVQRVEAVFFENHLYLHCSFANNSKADACIFRLTPIGGNDTEEFVVSRDGGYICSRTKNYQEAYSHITVSDLYMTQIEGNLSLLVDPVKKDTEKEYVALTKCKVRRPAAEGSIVGATVGGVTGGLVVVVGVIAIVCIISVLVWKRKVLDSVKPNRLYKVRSLVDETRSSTGKDEQTSQGNDKVDGPVTMETVQSDSGGSEKLTKYITIENSIITIKMKRILKHFKETDYSKLQLELDYS